MRIRQTAARIGGGGDILRLGVRYTVPHERARPRTPSLTRPRNAEIPREAPASASCAIRG